MLYVGSGRSADGRMPEGGVVFIPHAACKHQVIGEKRVKWR